MSYPNEAISWARNPDGSWRLPRWTLGWDAIDWCADNLVVPDGVRAGEPWAFTGEQARLVLWWYAVDDRGKFIYRDGLIRRMKGWGKDPFTASLAWNELLGPCRFGGWDADHNPIAVPVHAPWVQIIGVSQDATKNTTEALRPMVGGKSGAKRLGVELGREVTYSANGRLEIVTSSPRTLEGNRPTFCIRSEVHLWTPSMEGQALAAVIQRNLGKNSDGSARGLSITNAHIPGQQSVGEADYDLSQLMAAGKTVRSDYLYDSIEAPPDTDFGNIESLTRGVKAAAGDSWWVPVDRIVDEILDPRTTVSDSRRFYLNQIVSADDALFDLHDWQACRRTDRLTPGDTIALCFDGSSSGDTTGLVACRVSDGLLSVIGHWEPWEFGGEIPREDVDARVRRTMDEYNVVGFFADVRMWESYIDTWARDFGDSLTIWAGAKTGRSAHAVAWDMRGRLQEFTEATGRFVSDVLDGSLVHDGNPKLTQHVMAARRSVNRWGYSIRKASLERRQDKIDLAVTAIGARMVRRIAFASGVNTSPPKKYGAFSF